VNQYLMEHHEVCLEEVLSDAVDRRASGQHHSPSSSR
jgi:hypothetical protein